MSNVTSIEIARQERMSGDKPALNDGYCRVVNALAEGLARTALTSLEHRVVWAVIRLTYGWQKGKDRIAASQLAKATGLTRQKCSSTLSGLIERGIVIREGGSQSAIKINTKTEHWAAREKATKAPQKSKVNPISKNGSLNPITVIETNPITVHTKDSKDIYRKTTSYSPSPSDSQADQPESKAPKKNPCPYEKIVDLYHEALPQLSEVKILNPKRKSQIKARWQQKIGRDGQRRCDELAFWEKFFAYVSTCPFLIGQSTPSAGRPVFFADLEWLTNATNFAKVVEGKYDAERGDA
jgi:phage replication O-like protein O